MKISSLYCMLHKKTVGSNYSGGLLFSPLASHILADNLIINFEITIKIKRLFDCG